MNKNLEIIISFRKFLLSKIETLTVEQLNAIPEPFNNNILWNIAHMNSVLQALCYLNSELPITVEEKHFHPFLPGTKPSGFIDKPEIDVIKQQFISSAIRLSRDLDEGLFKTYKKAEKIERIYSIDVESVHDAIKYVTHHDGVHFGLILSLKKM